MAKRPADLSRAPRDGVRSGWPRFDRKAGEPPTDVSDVAIVHRMDADPDDGSSVAAQDEDEEAPSAGQLRRVVQEALRMAAAVYDGRVDRGWTQAELAAQVGVSERTIRNIEGGWNFPDFATLALIAGVLDRDLVIHAHSPSYEETRRERMRRELEEERREKEREEAERKAEERRKKRRQRDRARRAGEGVEGVTKLPGLDGRR